MFSFAQSFSRHADKIATGRQEPSSHTAIKLPVFPAALEKWFNAFPAGGDIFIPWSAETLQLTSRPNIPIMLDGYRFYPEDGDIKDGVLQGKWDINHIVIGTLFGENPLVADLSRAEVPILVFSATLGALDLNRQPDVLFKTIDDFSFFLGVWLDAFFQFEVVYRNGYFNPAFYQLITLHLQQKLTAENIRHIFRFFDIQPGTAQDWQAGAKQEVFHYKIYLETLGENKSKVLLKLKDLLKLPLDQVKAKTASLPLLLSSGVGENNLSIAAQFETLGASVRIEKTVLH